MRGYSKHGISSRSVGHVDVGCPHQASRVDTSHGGERKVKYSSPVDQETAGRERPSRCTNTSVTVPLRVSQDGQFSARSVKTADACQGKDRSNGTDRPKKPLEEI